jgi:hypothetical protein
MAGLNFAGDPALSATQTLTEVDTAGFIAQRLWNNASGVSGQLKLETDPEGGIGIFYTSFIAQWQGFETASVNITAGLANQKMMKGGITGVTGRPAVVQITGIPWGLTNASYALLVYCDAPDNTSDAVVKCTLDSGGRTETLYFKSPANTSYAGSYTRAPFNSSADVGPQTPAGNVIIFRNLSAGDAAIALEPGESTPNAVVGLTGLQLVPMPKVHALAPRITGPLAVTATINVPFSYAITADTDVTVFDATGLPAGLTINRVTGQISGSPSAAGVYQVALKASNATGSATDTLVLTVESSVQTPIAVDLYLVPAVLVRGQVGRTYTIESADAMENSNAWRASGTITLTAPAQFYVDLSATNAAKRFYRAALQQ